MPDRITASAINKSMTYVPRDHLIVESDCAYSFAARLLKTAHTRELRAPAANKIVGGGSSSCFHRQRTGDHLQGLDFKIQLGKGPPGRYGENGQGDLRVDRHLRGDGGRCAAP